ncbi:MAG TPA: trypsin-like peptidase domain-containing protein [Candidatus Bathyarchaeia archaeon]|nr:trypsin-like peptidase domain-containing protein [Candidatus Bathyarchaeia archaeon]
MKNFLIVSAILLFITTPGRPQDSIISEMMETQRAIVEIKAENTDVFKTPGASAAIDPKTGRIVVARKLVRGSYERNGAGVVIHPSGIIVTNAHTINKANTIQVVLESQESFFAQPVQFINELDIALLKINAPRPLPFVQLADSDAIKLGQEVLTIGNSAFLKNTISGGQIIGIGVSRTLKHIGQQRTDLIQTTVNLYHGDSGGPLFNRHGQLIGLMTADEGAADHSSFAIPSNKIKKYLVEYLNSKKEKIN